LGTRKTILAIVIGIAAVLTAAGWTRNKLAADRQGEWVRVTRGDLVSGVDITGTLAAVDSGSFGPPQVSDTWEFKLSMLAPEGTDIKKGQPVMVFDTSQLQKRLDEKTAEAEQARKEIEKKRADLSLRREDERLHLAEAEQRARKSELKLQGPTDIVSVKERKQVQLDFEVAKNEAKTIRARIVSLERAANAEIALLTSKQQHAEAVVKETQDGIQKMTVIAPRNGTVVYVTNWRGDKKKVGDSVWRMEHVVEIPDLARMMAKGDVDESDAGKVAVGQRVTLTLDAHPDEELHGTIKETARTVQRAQGSSSKLKVLRVDIVLDKSDPAKMRPGMRFHGTVELSRAKSALLVPKNAVYLSPRGPIAYRRDAFSITPVLLKLGVQNEKTIEVVSGLGEKDRVLVPKTGEKDEKS
jgi:multidrug resistance efflux pump